MKYPLQSTNLILNNRKDPFYFRMIIHKENPSHEAFIDEIITYFERKIKVYQN